jgi:RNA polymerase sigma factor (TIGR02999 family)
MPDVTRLLRAYAQGDPQVFDVLVPLVYEDLRRLARAQLRRQPGRSLDTIGLVHEAYLRLVDQTAANWQDRSHFLAVAAIAMRQILVDRARARLRQKRGAGQVVEPLEDDEVAAVAADAEQMLIVDDALRRLADVDPRLVRVVECRYFAGLSEAETAQALGTSLRTVQRDWLKARAWLRTQLQSTVPGPAREA